MQSLRIGIDTQSRPGLTTLLYGLAHFAVDLTSIATLYTAARSGLFAEEWVAVLILGYDYLAFASQMFIGILLDRLGISGGAAALGCALTAAGAWLGAPAPVAAVALVALGNALFHVGGGTVCLRLAPGKAIWAGLFVAPGAIGLFLGKMAGGTALFLPWALTLLMAGGAAAGLLAQAPRRENVPPFPAFRGFAPVVAALLVTVVVRSLVGFSVTFPWAEGWPQALLLTLAVFLGKAAGGALGDALGWRRVTVAGLLLSAPLLALGAGSPAFSLAGLMLFNLTMAVTLAGLAAMLPGYEGFAFGLTTTAIIVGLTPTIVPGWKPLLGSPAALSLMIVLSAAALWAALKPLDSLRNTLTARHSSGRVTGQIDSGGSVHA